MQHNRRSALANFSLLFFLSLLFPQSDPPCPSAPGFRACTGSGRPAFSVRMTVAVAVVAVVSAGAGDAVEATGADAGADVVGDAIHVHLTQVIAVGGHDAVWCVLESRDVVVSIGSDVACVGRSNKDNEDDQQ